jgi:hypothetical protein
MERRHLLVILPALLLTLLPGQPACAGVFFGKKVKQSPAERVPELIKTLKTDGDEHKRCSAAEELRQYDPMQFPEIVPALIDALLNDKKPAVRSESAQSLGKLRPVTSAAGAALEQSLAKDNSMRVRLQARSSLLQYRWAGYTPKGKDEPAAESKEPPLAADVPPATARTAPPRSTSVSPPRSAPPDAPRPLPTGSLEPPVATPAPIRDLSGKTQATPTSITKPVKPAEETGPDLTPP